MLVDVEHQERYWYPDDGGEVWVAGYHVVDESGRFVGRDALPDGLIVANVAGAVHRPEALASDGAAPGSPLVLRAGAGEPARPERGRGAARGRLAARVRAAGARAACRAGWSAVVLRERRASPRDPRTGVTMLVAAEAIELRIR